MLEIKHYRRDVFGPFYVKGHDARPIKSRADAAAFIAKLEANEKNSMRWRAIEQHLDRAWMSRSHETEAERRFGEALLEQGWLDASPTYAWAM